MASSTIKTRFQLKSDTEANWAKAINFVPLRGEPIIFLPDEAHHFFRMKIGDGNTYLADLPFFTGNETTSFIIYNTTEWFNSHPTFIPAEGILVIYSDGDEIIINNNNMFIPKIKVGDGKTYCVDLPFINDNLLNTLTKHINNTDIHVTQQEKQFWNNKLQAESVQNETLTLSRN